jgi:uncharacterized protein YcbX
MQVTQLWRHPVKSLGREPLERLTLIKGEAVPFDRLWAVAHDASDADGTAWAACQNFIRGAGSPALMAVTCTLDAAGGTLTVRHPDRPDLSVQPDTQGAVLLEWMRPLCNPDRPQPAHVFRLRGRGFTDTAFPSVSLCNHASHLAVEGLAAVPLQMERWRGNIWFDGAAPWQEFDWLGLELRIGGARLKIEERIRRCVATTTNTDKGLRDVDTLAALNTQGHQNFGVYATVVQTGEISVGDPLEPV